MYNEQSEIEKETMWSEVGEKIQNEMTTEFASLYLTCSTFAPVNHTSVNPFDKLLIDLACSVCTSETSDF